MKQRIKFIFTTWFIAISLFTINAQDVQTNKNDMENLNLTNEWDKTSVSYTHLTLPTKLEV